MTAATDDIKAYAETAYRSNRKQPELSESNQQSTLFRKGWTMGPPLSTGRLSYIHPDGFLDDWTPKRLRDYEEIEEKKGVTEIEERHTYLGRLDEKMLRYATLPKTSWILVYMRHLGRVIFFMLAPIILLVLIFGWTQIASDVSLQEFFLNDVIHVFSFLLLPFLLSWGVGVFIEKKFPHIMYREPKGPLWELNRQTGQVILYHHPENSDRPGEIDVEAPFHEWDGYMLRLPDHQGFIWYKLVLVHKTREWALPLNQLVAATTIREEVFAYWDLVRHYMDVCKPLPDIPLFETFRHLDLTSAAHDKKHGRDPQYWRNMDEATYKAFRSENSKKLHSHQWV